MLLFFVSKINLLAMVCHVVIGPLSNEVKVGRDQSPSSYTVRPIISHLPDHHSNVAVLDIKKSEEKSVMWARNQNN